jgi:hypothetical protein
VSWNDFILNQHLQASSVRGASSTQQDLTSLSRPLVRHLWHRLKGLESLQLPPRVLDAIGEQIVVRLQLQVLSINGCVSKSFGMYMRTAVRWLRNLS